MWDATTEIEKQWIEWYHQCQAYVIWAESPHPVILCLPTVRPLPASTGPISGSCDIFIGCYRIFWSRLHGGCVLLPGSLATRYINLPTFPDLSPDDKGGHDTLKGHGAFKVSQGHNGGPISRSDRAGSNKDVGKTVMTSHTHWYLSHQRRSAHGQVPRSKSWP